MLPRAAAPIEGRTRVMVDPGHGGNDQGGSGRLTTDRDVALAVALELRRQLDTDPRFEVLLTRDDDRFVRLEDRTELARQAHADCFVSLHANVWHGPGGAQGVQVSYASEPLLARELDVTMRDRGLLPQPSWPCWSFAPESALEVTRLLETQRATQEHSRLLSHLVLDGIVTRTAQRTRGVRQNGYRVLRPHEFPSCLVELGFLTDAAEEARMITPEWREAAAHGIADGLGRWLELTHAPLLQARVLAALPPSASDSRPTTLASAQPRVRPRTQRTKSTKAGGKK